ncbi:unnamed protein product [Brassica rapa subsp. trilocularis]
MLKTKRMILDVISLMMYLMYNCVVYSSSLASQRLHAAGMCLEKSNSMTLNSMLSLRKCTMKRNNHNVNHYKKTAVF